MRPRKPRRWPCGGVALCFLIYTSKLTVGKIGKAITKAGIIYSFLFCVQFLDMVTLPNERFILSEQSIGPNYAAGLYFVCV